MFKGLDLVIFDMDGLMFDTERVYMKVVIDALNERNISFDLATLYQSLGTTQFDMRSILTGEVPVGLDLLGLIKEVQEKAVIDLCDNGVPLKPGLLELLTLLEELNIKKVVASSTRQNRCQRYLQASNLIDRFDLILTGSDVVNVKPHPELFLKVCELTGTKKEQAIILEDSMNGAVAAHRAGIKCILVPDIVAPTEEIKSIVYCILDSLYDVANLLS